MTLDDFLEHFYAKLRSYAESDWSGAVMVRRDVFPTPDALRAFLRYVAAAHLFCLGDEDAINESARLIGHEVYRETLSGLPMPFENMAMVWRSQLDGWIYEWLARSPEKPASASESFCYAVISEKTLSRDELEAPVFFRNNYSSGQPIDICVYAGSFHAPGETVPPRPPSPRPSPEEMKRTMGWLNDAFLRCAAISHPALYVVLATASLTPRETRQAQKSGRPPDRKRPRYLVIDYDGLQQLRRPTDGLGTSPTPHERRGHWRRLAEQCVHARASGRNRVWVRPTVVGDLQFSDARARYEVILNPMADSARRTTSASARVFGALCTGVDEARPG